MGCGRTVDRPGGNPRGLSHVALTSSAGRRLVGEPVERGSRPVRGAVSRAGVVRFSSTGWAGTPSICRSGHLRKEQRRRRDFGMGDVGENVEKGMRGIDRLIV